MKHCRCALAFMAALISVLLAPAAVPAQEAAPVQVAAYTEEAILFREIPSVYGASKYEQKVTEAPSSVSIITADEIRRYGYRTLADILKSVRSFYVTYDRNYSYVGVRGFGRPGDYNTRILLLIDGHRTNENVYDGAYVGTDAIIDADLIDRVEIIRGPGSSLYGSNAFFAVINVITRRGRDVKGLEASGEGAGFRTVKGRATYGNRYSSGLEVLISGSAYESKGQDLFYPDLGWTRETDADRSGQGFFKLSFGDLMLSGASSSRAKGIPTGAFGTDFGDPANKTRDKRSYFDLGYSHQFGGQTDLSARAYYDHYKYEGDYKYAGVLNRDRGYGTWWGGEVKLITALPGSQRLTAGAELVEHRRQDQENHDIDPYALYTDVQKHSNIWAVYLQDEITLAKELLLNAGIRYDRYDGFGGTTNPRLALLFAPDEKSAVKFLAGSAFRAPNVFELYFVSLTNEPNPALQPEKIATYELVYEQYFGNLRAALGGYYYRTKDLINQVETAPGITSFRNIDKVTARGGEFEIENTWSPGIEGKLSYTIQRAEDKLTGEPLTNSPAHLAKLSVTVPVIARKVLVGVEEQVMSRRRTVNGSTAGGFAVTNLTVFSREVLDRLEVSASVYNLFDKEYGDPVSADLSPLDTVPQDGRNYRVKLVYSF